MRIASLQRMKLALEQLSRLLHVLLANRAVAAKRDHDGQRPLPSAREPQRGRLRCGHRIRRERRARLVAQQAAHGNTWTLGVRRRSLADLLRSTSWCTIASTSGG